MSKKVTHADFVQKVHNIYGDKYSVVSTYTRTCDTVDLKCNQCDTIFARIANSVTSKKSICCPVCDSKKISNTIIKGINDLWTIRPDVAKLLANKELGYLYRENSDYETDFCCPFCHSLSKKNIRNVSNSGFSCSFCNDSISYPNKFMAHFLREMRVPFQSEYTISPYSYRYDFCFELNNKHYVVELDGAYGHGELNIKDRTIEKQIYDDEEKDRIARENGFIMIRINCKYKDISERFSYIEQSLNSSLLKHLFQYDSNLLVLIDKKCEKSIVVEISEKWNEGMRSYDEFKTIFGIERPGIRRYLKRGCDIGLINIDYKILLDTIRLVSNKKISISKGKKVRCNETGEEFCSMSDAERKTGFHIRNYFARNDKYCGQLPNGTKLTWSLVTE